MEDKYYKILGADASDSDEVLKQKYDAIRAKYLEDRFKEGEEGNRAAEKLTEIENAYEEIKSLRNQNIAASEGEGLFADIDAAIKKGDLQTAQQKLDSFDERNAEWHYYQSVVFYKKNWINESKKQLELAIQIDGNCQKYKDALKKLNEKAGSEQKINPDWNKSGNSVYSGDDDAQQLGGDSCAEWCCKMAICNFLLNCCCNCR